MKMGNKKPHILVESPIMLPSVKVGVLNLLERLSDKCETQFKSTFDIREQDIRWSDILISVRGCESMALEIAKTAKKYGRFVIYYLDDDLLELPESAVSSEFYQRESNRQNLKDLIGLSDVFWTNNHKLIERYSQYSKTARYFRCDIISDNRPLRLKNNGGITKILYAGSVDHSNLVKKYIVPALEKITQEYGEKISITFVGVESGMKKSPFITEYAFIEDYNAYRNLMENSGFDIGLGIIDTSDFYQCKYYNKFLEYTSLGIVGIYTDSYPYKYIIENGKNGLLVENSINTWYEGIKKLIDCPEHRVVWAENARHMVDTQFNETKVLGDLLKAVPELISYQAPMVRSKIRLKNGKLVYLKQRLADYWKADRLMFLPNVVVAALKKNYIYIEHRKRKKNVF